MMRLVCLSVVVVLAAGSVASAGPVADLLMLHLDETRGTWANDVSAANNNGTLLNGGSWNGGQYGGGALLDGADDHIDCGADASLRVTDAITAEAWFYPLHLGGSPQTVIQKGRDWWAGYQLAVTGSTLQGVIQGASGGQVVYAPGAVTLNDWNHALLTYQSGVGGAVYLNGVATPIANVGDIKWVDTGAGWDYSTRPFLVGEHYGIYRFDGMIDEVAVYGQSLSAADATARYTAGPPLPPPQLPTADGLVLHFDEAGGITAYDATSPANNGTLDNGVGRGAGVYGGAVHFDGVDDRIRVPLPAAQSPTTGLTVEGWFLVDQNPNVDGNNNWRWIFNKGGWGTPFDCILEQNRSLMFSLKVDGDSTHYRWNSGLALPLDEWAHAAWTYDAESGMMRVYVNGVEAAHYIGTTGPLATNDTDFFLSWASGTAFPNGSGAFPGWMDEIALYSRALSQDEVLARYADGPPIFPEPATLAVLAGGVAALAARRRRRK